MFLSKWLLVQPETPFQLSGLKLPVNRVFKGWSAMGRHLALRFLRRWVGWFMDVSTGSSEWIGLDSTDYPQIIRECSLRSLP